MWRTVLTIVLASVAYGCTPKIDGSSPEAFEQSLTVMAKKMSPEEQRQLGRDLKDATDLRQANVAHVLDPALRQQLQQKLREQLDGKTAKEIHEAAISIRAKMRQQQRASLVDAIAEAEKGLALARDSNAALARLSVTDAIHSFSPAAQSDVREQSMIRFTLKNDTPYTLTDTVSVRAAFQAFPEADLLDGTGHFAQPIKPSESGVVTVSGNTFMKWPRSIEKAELVAITVNRARVTDEFLRHIPMESARQDELKERLEQFRRKLQELDAAPPEQ